MIFDKIKKLTKKVFSTDTYILPLLNKHIPIEIGKITHMQVDRETKIISLELSKEKQKATLIIEGYGLEYSGLNAYLVFEKISQTGYLNRHKFTNTIEKKIKIDQKYIHLVRRLV